MPYTLAHPIATAPLWYLSRQRLNLSALAVGSMMPDISYFIALQPVSNIGHTWQGVLSQGLPAGLIVLALFYSIIARPLHRLWSGLGLGNFPAHQSLGRQGYDFWPLPRLLTIILSLILGASSHILWDSFTHDYGWFVERWPLLQQVVLGLPIYKLLQYGGGLVGLVAIALWFRYEQAQNHPVHPPEKPLSTRAIALSLAVIALFTFGFAAASITLHRFPNEALTSVIVRAVTGGTSGLFLGLFVYGLSDAYRSVQKNRLK